MSVPARLARLQAAVRRPAASVFAPASLVEPMEARTLFSTTVALHGTTLLIDGDDKPNRISVTVDASAVTVLADGITKKFSFGASQPGTTAKVNVQDISITSRGGNDVVSLAAKGKHIPRAVLRCVVDGGSGDDQIVSRMTAPSTTRAAGSATIGSDWSLTVKGGTGNDRIDCDTSIGGSNVGTAAKSFVWEKIRNLIDGGTGDDDITCRIDTDDVADDASPRFGWDVSCTVTGGTGDDSLDVQAEASQKKHVSNFKWSCITDGGAGDDGVSASVAIPSGAAAFYKMTWITRGAAGDDSISARCAVGDDLDSDNDSIPDLVSADVSWTVDGGAGSDVVDATASVSGRPQTSARFYIKFQGLVTGGAGDDYLTAEVITAREAGSGMATGMVVSGGDGDDSITCASYGSREAGSGQATGRRMVVYGGNGFDSAYVTDEVQTVDCEDVIPWGDPHENVDGTTIDDPFAWM